MMRAIQNDEQWHIFMQSEQQASHPEIASQLKEINVMVAARQNQEAVERMLAREASALPDLAKRL